MPFAAAKREYNEGEEVAYENRAVAFIDILGWGKAVEDSATSPELRRKLLNAVWALGAHSKRDVEDATPDCPSFDRATQFSDSVVVSMPYTGHLELMRLMRHITSYQHTMLLLGLPLRGGVAVGPLYHDGPLVFGPALNEAYNLERHVAAYPRVVIAKSLNSQVEMAASTLPPHWSFVVKDSDNYYSTDFLMMLALSEQTTEQIDRKIDHWLSLHRHSDRIYRKYARLRESWEAAKADSAWRKEASRRLREAARPST